MLSVPSCLLRNTGNFCGESMPSAVLHSCYTADGSKTRTCRVSATDEVGLRSEGKSETIRCRGAEAESRGSDFFERIDKRQLFAHRFFSQNLCASLWKIRNFFVRSVTCETCLKSRRLSVYLGYTLLKYLFRLPTMYQ